MIPILFNYATPSVLESTRARDLIGLSADLHRPVRFFGRLTRNLLSIRTALSTLGDVVAHEDSWRDTLDFVMGGLDPVVSVLGDRIVLEGFARDLGAIGVLEIDRAGFETEGPVVEGTTNVDFTAWLGAAINELRSSRSTHLRIAADGVEVTTAGAGGRYEQKVELPTSWVIGLLQAQSAMVMPGTRIEVRPVDLLAAIRWLRFQKARVSPRALRWEMEPGQDVRLVLEPWETVVPLRGASHGYPERRVVRTWGRRRLRLLEPLLPLADRVEVYLKGRGLPVFVVVTLPGCRFTLGFGTSGFEGLDLLSDDAAAGSGGSGSAGSGEATLAEAAIRELRAGEVSAETLALRLGTPLPDTTRVLARLVRLGRVGYDLVERRYRHRELFSPPLPVDVVMPPDPRRQRARLALDRGEVQDVKVEVRESRVVRRLAGPDGPMVREVVHRDHVLSGRVATHAVTVVISSAGRLIFGTCGCEFFKEHTLSRGPCADMLALRLAAGALPDLPTSEPATAPARPPVPRPDRDDEEEEDDEEADENEDEDEEDDDDKPRSSGARPARGRPQSRARGPALDNDDEDAAE